MAARIKQGDRIEISAGRWRGSKTRDGRNEGIMIRIGPSSFGDVRIEIELSYDEFGKLVAGLGGTGTVNHISDEI
jgi:hypothetical protein